MATVTSEEESRLRAAAEAARQAAFPELLTAAPPLQRRTPALGSASAALVAPQRSHAVSFALPRGQPTAAAPLQPAFSPDSEDAAAAAASAAAVGPAGAAGPEAIGEDQEVGLSALGALRGLPCGPDRASSVLAYSDQQAVVQG